MTSEFNYPDTMPEDKIIEEAVVLNAGYGDINPVSFGEHRCPPSHDCGPNLRHWWILHYIISGKGTFCINGKTYQCGAGDIFVIPPEVLNHYYADEKDPWHYTWVGFTTTLSLPFLLPPIFHCPDAEEDFHAMRKSIYMENGQSIFLNAYIWKLFSMFTEQQLILPEKKTDHINDALNYMQLNFSQALSVEDIAHRLHLNRSYFSAQFKKRTGHSPQQYLLHLRMTVAAGLLSNTDNRISVIARSVGYTDLYNFSRMFKKFHGISPSEYIRRHRQ